MSFVLVPMGSYKYLRLFLEVCNRSNTLKKASWNLYRILYLSQTCWRSWESYNYFLCLFSKWLLKRIFPLKTNGRHPCVGFGYLKLKMVIPSAECGVGVGVEVEAGVGFDDFGQTKRQTKWNGFGMTLGGRSQLQQHIEEAVLFELDNLKTKPETATKIQISFIFLDYYFYQSHYDKFTQLPKWSDMRSFL